MLLLRRLRRRGAKATTAPLPAPVLAAPPSGADSRVVRVRTFSLQSRLPQAMQSAQHRIERRFACLVQVETANGAIGWGECAGPPPVAQAAIESCYGPMLVGRDAFEGDALWHDLWREMQPWGGRGMMLSALSGLDMALWDARGQLTGRSASEMWGGRVRETVPCYATGLFFRDRPEAELIPTLIEEAQRYLADGYRAVKMQIGRNLTFDMALIRALRLALPDTPLMADAGRAYNLSEAGQIGRVLDDLDFALLEDALAPDLHTQYRELANRLCLPLAAGESEQMRWGFHDLLQSGAIRLAQPNLGYCGGPTEALRIRAVASTLGVALSPQGSGTLVNFAAALHFAASEISLPGRSQPALAFIGRDATYNPLRDTFFTTPLLPDGGLIRVPTGPGLGVTIDMAAMRQFCVRETETG